MKRTMGRLVMIGVVGLLLGLPGLGRAAESACIGCHKEITPNIVKDFLSGAMGQSGMDCAACHGTAHTGKDDVAKVTMPTEKTCQKCHEQQHAQYADGKHALGWVAMSSMPTNAIQPHAYIQGLKGDRKSVV